MIEELSPHSASSIDSDTLMRRAQSITGDEASGLSRSSKANCQEELRTERSICIPLLNYLSPVGIRAEPEL